MKLDDAYFQSLLSRIHGAIAEASAPGEIAEPARATQIPASAIEEPRSASAVAVADEPPAAGRTSDRSGGDTTATPKHADLPFSPDEFWPLAPASWAEMKFSESAAEELVLKCLLTRVTATGRQIAEHIAVPFGLLSSVLEHLKSLRLVIHKGDAPFNDYVYQLSEAGLETAARYADLCAYDGTAPVVLQDYIDSVHAQSIHRCPPAYDDVAAAFSDLVLDAEVLDQVGQAIHAGHGFFLYGEPGNGKTSIAERVSRVFGQTIWIPRTLSIDGLIIRMFDPCNHMEVAPENKDGLYDRLKIDGRWVRIVRPTILAGGELTMDRLEIRTNKAAGVNEAPLQLKSNCGTLVIDDFGRQRMRADELLNRWIVPLDRRYDLLNLPNGKAIQVPFDQLLIFSTNMQPEDLADEAFLRRIPYKIRVSGPNEPEFKQLFRREAERLGMAYDESTIDSLIERHYRGVGRSFRCCHARDLLKQIKHYCQFKKLPLEMTRDRFDIAVRNYFAAVGA